jgi:hypothetical protein
MLDAGRIVASTITKPDGSRMPSENELAGARLQGRHVAQIDQAEGLRGQPPEAAVVSLRLALFRRTPNLAGNVRRTPLRFPCAKHVT